MGFKADSSFLRFLTMGALGTRHVITELQSLGFKPIELERYSTSNKIWSTKIKRLRLPDLLCVRTGLRVEVRAKSNLEIRMSHAPNNPDRLWDSGLRNEDVIALIVCQDIEDKPTTVGASSFFKVSVLRDSVDEKQLSRLKAASEGSEQHLTWPSVVSRRPGKVLALDSERLFVEWVGDGEPTRRYGYTLRGKLSYVREGDTFPAETKILAGTPASFADLRPYLRNLYEPLHGLTSDKAIDRYSAAKALPFREDLHRAGKPIVEKLVGQDSDQRIALEIANAAAALGSNAGKDYLHTVLIGDTSSPMRMEAVFITTELGRGANRRFAADELDSIAGNTTLFSGDEIRQAAVWGLGHSGLRAYDRLLPYLTDAEENVVLHAIAAFGNDTPHAVIDRLVQGLLDGDDRRVAASSEALRLIGSEGVMARLIAASRQRHGRRPWVIATLGRLPGVMLRTALAGDALYSELEPLLLVSSSGWLTKENTSTSLQFLTKQSL